MSVYSNHVRKGSNDSDRSQLNRINADEYENEFNPKKEKLPNIVPEVHLKMLNSFIFFRI